MNRPLGFLQVDVDGLWAVRSCYGKPENGSYQDDPCWSEGVPRLDNLFRRMALPASFFLVGRDLEHPEKKNRAQQLFRQSYELGNHSYSHMLGLTRQPPGYILEELKRTDDLLRELGAKVSGFRSPGYDIDIRILRVVRRLGYLYDASVLPTYAAPALRLADAWLARRWDREKRQFGRFSYGRAPRKPYFPLKHALRKPALHREDAGVLEIPVGTTPRLRLPLTGASLLGASRRELRGLFRHLAERRRPALLLLHAIDATDCRRPIVFDNRRPSLAGFRMSGRKKERQIEMILDEFARQFCLVRADEYARQRWEARQ